jgi:hypothetical protein
MPVDPEDLRQYYASLSDEALLAIARADLIDMAQNLYDEEFARRRLHEPRHVTEFASPEEAGDVDYAMSDDGEKPGWLDEAVEVYSQAAHTGVTPERTVQARDVLEAAGVPCYLDAHEIDEEESAALRTTHEWRLMVPGTLNLRATSVLERDIFNVDFEAEWKTHLETFSDAELRAMNPQFVFCGLFDKIERVTRAYSEELGRRKLASEST